LSNFLSNSLKFTERNGTIVISIKVTEHRLSKRSKVESKNNLLTPKIKRSNSEIRLGDERFVNLQISVKDTGLGISEQGIDKLFVDFGKLDENSSKNL
jgi:signal transduction histidine kinase